MRIIMYLIYENMFVKTIMIKQNMTKWWMKVLSSLIIFWVLIGELLFFIVSDLEV